MKKLLLPLIASTLVPLCAGAGNNDPNAGQYDVLTTPEHSANAYRQGELIVKLRTENVSVPVRLKGAKGKVKANASATALNSLLSKYGIEEAEELMPLTGSMVTPKPRRAKSLNGQDMPDSDLSSLYVLRFDPQKAIDIRAIADEFSKLADVDYAEPNYLFYICSSGTAADYTTDPLYSEQWDIRAINVDKLWDKPVINSKRPVIAILDTGVEITHPDLSDNIWINSAEESGAENYDDDSNGFIDDLHGWDFVNQTGSIRDNNGHGTHCAGIAAAVGGNGIGITGANPDALIMPVTVIQSDGYGDMATIVRGIDYAMANGADVLSMSFTTMSNSIALHDALAKAYQKAVLVAAAGNDGYDLSCTLPPGHRFPAAYNFVIGVMASMENGQTAPFSMTDMNGPIVSSPWDDEDELWNYEVTAPGTNILSTYPGGSYKTLSGTSMSCPLVAGALSRLYQCKDIINKEILFGDLIHSLKDGFCTPLDFEAAYNITDDNRIPEIYYVSQRIDDPEGDADLRVDAGETIDLYVSLRNAWGNARNIKLNLELGENEDPEIVELIEPNVDFGHSLSGYAQNESRYPLRFKISDKCTDTRRIRFVLTATCEGGAKDVKEEFVIVAENGIELGGIIAEDQTLYPDKYYIVTNNLGIPDGVTLTLMPGTKLYFHKNCGISVSRKGSFVAKGTPDNRIYFLPAGEQYATNLLFDGKNSQLEYCVFEDLSIENLKTNTNFTKNIIQRCGYGQSIGDRYITGSYNLYSKTNRFESYGTTSKNTHSTAVNNHIINNGIFHNGNLINNYLDDIVILSEYSDVPVIVERRVYPGTTREDLFRHWFIDIKNPTAGSTTFAEISRKHLLSAPDHEAPGCVWKVLVDGYDALDERELLSDLGVGRHKFDVYFSKQMNHDYEPSVTMGVRSPYNQISLQEDGQWHTEISSRPITAQDLTWTSTDPAIYVDADGNLHAGSSAYNSAIITGKIDDREVNFTVTLSGGPHLNKSKEYLVTGETTKLEIIYVLYGIIGTTWKSSNESVIKVDNNGLVTAIGPGKATVTAEYQYYDLSGSLDVPINAEITAEITVFDSEIPDGLYPLFDEIYIKNGDIMAASDFLKESKFPFHHDVYTVWHTIHGRDNYDGLNRIAVSGAYDCENFPCPTEDYRFNVNVQSAGSMSTGFTAMAGLGKVTLTWEDPADNLDDLLGYNIYRYTLEENDLPSDTIRINKNLIADEEYIDYDITPGTTYCYYYTMLRTSFDETAKSRVVSATPYASIKGDSNGSGAVDVADVITDVNYMVGRDPQPFIFEAADVNEDLEIDIRDVVGTVNIIMQPAAQSYDMGLSSVATYTIENGILYVDCPVELAGVQAELSGSRTRTEISVLPALRGMENTGDWVSDEAYRFVAFSLSGKTLDSGRHALLSIDDAELQNLILVDPAGNRVMAVEGSQSGISSIVMLQMKAPTPNPFVDIVNVPVIIGTDGDHAIELSMHDLSGTKVMSYRVTLGYGEHNITLNAGNLPNGFYLLTLTVDNTTVQTHKVIKK